MRTSLLLCVALALFGCSDLDPKTVPGGSSGSTGGAGGESSGGSLKTLSPSARSASRLVART
ncbi:MAG TPA: hypothetical protein PKA58_29700 [Polyangium sp.]|nr:hypothetical protein [Polyangium sp.]